jgi:hypothetical protein
MNGARGWLADHISVGKFLITNLLFFRKCKNFLETISSFKADGVIGSEDTQRELGVFICRALKIGHEN